MGVYWWGSLGWGNYELEASSVRMRAGTIWPEHPISEPKAKNHLQLTYARFENVAWVTSLLERMVVVQSTGTSFIVFFCIFFWADQVPPKQVPNTWYPIEWTSSVYLLRLSTSQFPECYDLWESRRGSEWHWNTLHSVHDFFGCLPNIASPEAGFLQPSTPIHW